jgi:predicted hotdog family 3-hydroxylacyl-ACP dehydratase
MNNYAIEAVLAHTQPMILLDVLDEYEEKTCTCHVTITEKSAFYNKEKQGVASYIGSEYMAQSIAAYAGAHALDEKRSVKIGFLLGSRRLKTFQPFFKLNQTVFIRIEELYKESSGLSVFDCMIKDDQGKLLAKANINVFQPQNPE